MFDALLIDMQKYADAQRAVKMSAYMKNRFEFMGVQAPQRRLACRPYFKNAKSKRGLDFSFVELCWDCVYREMQYAAVDYMVLKKEFLAPEDLNIIKRYIMTKSWWDTVDGLDELAGSIVLRHPECREVMLEWSVDENIWVRRAAIDHQLLMKGKTDEALLEEIILNNLGTDEFFINKAIGWSIREYAKTSPEWAGAFLKRNKERLSPLSYREAGKHLLKA